MATLGTLRDELRNRKLVEASTDFYGDAALLEMIVAASREISGAFRFPRKTHSEALTAGTVSFSPQSGVRDIMSLTFAGVSLPKISYEYVLFMQALVSESWPRGWNWDPNRTGDVQLGPPTPAGTVVTHYIGDPYSGTPVAGTDVWGGMHKDFHELVLLRSAVKAFEMGMEYENSGYYYGRYNHVLAEFAQYMNQGIPMVLQAGGGQ